MIAYASKSLSKTQRRYCVTKKELLAVVYFVGTKFRHYLLGEKFTVRTDHSSLRWLMSSFQADEGMIGRWLEILQVFDFVIEHRRGVLHGNADALSRQSTLKCPREDCPQCHVDVDLVNLDRITALHECARTSHRALLQC